MLCRPTKVAAANCHALLPESSHLGDGTSIGLSPVFSVHDGPPTTRADHRAERAEQVSLARQKPCQRHALGDSPEKFARFSANFSGESPRACRWHGFCLARLTCSARS